MRCAAIIVAGGAGSRADPQGLAPPKQYRMLAGRPVISRTISTFLAHPAIGLVQPVLKPGTEDHYRRSVGQHSRLLDPVAGGAHRQASVRLGLEALRGEPPDVVLIHDAVRPFVSSSLIDRVLQALSNDSGAVPGLPVADTLKRAGPSGHIEATIERSGAFTVQTPQGFRYDEIFKAHRRAAGTTTIEFTDDAAIAEWAGLSVALVQGDSRNTKLTTPEDFELSEAMLSGAKETRNGTGYDVHRFGPGDHVTIGGIRIPHDRELVGHSDADVGLHALTDALLGAIAEGDIGSHFPPTKPEWKGADSSIFLSRAGEIVRAKGGRIVNVDLTLICETPKIGPYRDAMRARIAEILLIRLERVSVKATTSEGLGFTGRGEGIAAHAVASVSLPREGDPP